MRKDKKTIVLCGGKKCCPELTITDTGKVKITDDYGNTVTMDKKQAKLIDSAIKELEKQ
jgi:hypothetical protein